ncbi:transcription initiation factor IIF, beta subunit-domain-containing protein [Entophlyctis helioformis]|nr:transcription initiation factor IIF, beta subunit-domain-containing protein [Entophlyctis helioformis]
MYGGDSDSDGADDERGGRGVKRGRAAADDLDDLEDIGNDDLADDEDEDTEFKVDAHTTRVWLVKVPKFLADKWNDVGARNPGSQLGTLKVNKAMSKATLHVPETPWSATVPKNYNLEFTNMHPQNVYVFSESAMGKAVGVVGTVQHEATVMPIIDDEYQRIMKRRTNDASTSSRVVKRMDDRSAESKRLLASSGDSWNASLEGFQKKKGTGTLDKRERMPRNELLDTLFALFAEYKYWNFKGLVDRTQQPQSWLKEVLNELCVLNKRGPYNGMYELKPEFMTSGSAAADATGVAPGGSG